MPERETIRRARKDAEEGKSPSTQAGEFVREEIHHVREGKHGVKNPKQAIAIGLSKARKAGVRLAPPRKGTAQKESRRHRSTRSRTSAKRSRATTKATSSRSQAARKAARTRASRRRARR
ncbi:MAG: transcription elongation factor [Acidobacteria bacterium]|nr:MAG: transcription elongation factor [Acidobacteriota bacterium]